MRKFTPSIKVKKYATHQSQRVGDNAFEKFQIANIFFAEVAGPFLFMGVLIKETFSCNFEVKEFFRQCYQIGYKSLPLISVTGIIIGLVLTIQSRTALVNFGAVSMLPGMVSLSIIKEIGPVITALLCAGKIGSSMGAELASMKVTEQIEAMEVSSINPMRFLVVTQVAASTIMIPLLVLYADALGILGSWAGANIKGGVNFTLFFPQAFKSIEFIDFIPAVVKTFFSVQ